MRFPAVVFVGLALAILTGCGGDGSGKADGSSKDPATNSSSSTPSPSTSPTVAAIDCQALFARADAVILAAEDLGRGHPEPFSGLTACRWDAATSGAWVQVLSVPASQWASILPDAIGAVLDSDLDFAGRDKLDDARKLIENGGKLDDKAACDIFSTMVSSLQNYPAGTTKVYNYIPNDSAPQGINGQACVNGHFSSVQVIVPNLTRGPEIEARIKHALALLLK